MLDIQIDPVLMKAVIVGTGKGFSMAGVEPIPVGASSLSSAPHSLSVIVGVAGRNAGTVVLNMTEPTMLKLTGEFLAEPQTELTEENIDAVMELGNMVAGSIKESLSGTEYELNLSSLPSLVMGQSYEMVFVRGIITAQVQFEVPGMPTSAMGGRFMYVSISLLRRAGK